MARICGLEPIARPDARSLILGSMPGRESLRQGRYYAHPRNAFWPIVSALLSLPDADYSERVECVMRRGFAVWDVLQACDRPSSLDADIAPDSVVANDFRAFFGRHRNIRRVFFNGAAAETLFRRHVLAALPERWQALRYQRLPSTSPAHAGMSLQQKRRHWRAIMETE